MVIPRALFLFMTALTAAVAVSAFSLAVPSNDGHGEELRLHPHPMASPSLFHDHHGGRAATCHEFPRACRAKGGGGGRRCCRRRCFDVETDALNCGGCGRRCRFGWACCGGRCANVMFDGKHCGGCKRKCKKGSLCRYGMCSYAN